MPEEKVVERKWFAVYRKLNGELYSIGESLAEKEILDEKGFDKVELAAKPLPTDVWNPVTHAFTPGVPVLKTIEERLGDNFWMFNFWKALSDIVIEAKKNGLPADRLTALQAAVDAAWLRLKNGVVL
jgi:hypothetical protein